MCLQEIYTGGWYKALQQCVCKTSTSVFLQCFHKAFIHVAKLVHKLYECFCKVFIQFVQVCFERFLQHLYMCFWKVFTAVVQVLFERCLQYVYMCFERCLQRLRKCFLRGFYSICTSVLYTASTQFVQVLLQGCTAVVHRFWTLSQHAYKCFARLLEHSYKFLLQGLYSSCKKLLWRVATTCVHVFWRFLQQLYKCSLTGFCSSCASVCEGLLQHFYTCFW